MSLLCNMGLKEAWNPTFPSVYELEIKGYTSSSERSGEAPRIQDHSDSTGAANVAQPPQEGRAGGGVCVWGGVIY